MSLKIKKRLYTPYKTDPSASHTKFSLICLICDNISQIIEKTTVRYVPIVFNLLI